MKDLVYFLFLSGSVRFADQWLGALCNSVKECHSNQRGIGNHTVGSDTDITGKRKDDHIKYHGNDSG